MTKSNRLPSRPVLPVISLIIVIIAASLGGGYVYLHRTEANTPVTTNGWQTYTSTASSAHFLYPSDWHIVRTTLGIAQPNWLLENISIAGPNSFTLTFQVQKVHVNPALLCARTYDSAPIALNSAYSMLLEGSDAQHIATAYLVDNSSGGNVGGYACGRGYSINTINVTTGFVLYGRYTSTTSREAAMPETDFENAPEVVLAKAIFASFVL